MSDTSFGREPGRAAPDGGAAIVPWVLDLLARAEGETAAAEAEQFLLETQRTSAIGRLLGGIAHDLSNMLGPVAGFAELVEAAPELSAQTRRWTGILRENAARSAQFTHSLLAFGRLGRAPREVVDGRSLLNGVLELARYHLERARVQVQITGDADLPLVDVQPGELQQIFLDLLLQAADTLAAAGGGRLDIRCGAADNAVAFEFACESAASPAGEAAGATQRPRGGRQGDAAAGEDRGRSLLDAFGLAAARHLARRLGGELTGARDGGAPVFRLTLPAWKAR